MKFVKVKSIKLVKSEPIYHLVVDKNHNFFANGLCVHNCDYLDELFVLIYNLGKETFIIREGDRIAQCVLKQVEQAEFDVVDDFDEETKKKDRGGGLGSTGI